MKNGRVVQNDVDVENCQLCERYALTIQEASRYTGIGINKIRELCNDVRCTFVINVGTKKLIKRKIFEEYLNAKVAI